jgi:hypothetical protein
MFVNSVLVYGITVLSCLGARESDRYQCRILTTGILFSLTLTGMLAIYEGEFLSFANVMPGFTIVMMMLSMLMHELQIITPSV